MVKDQSMSDRFRAVGKPDRWDLRLGCFRINHLRPKGLSGVEMVPGCLPKPYEEKVLSKQGIATTALTSPKGPPKPETMDLE